MKKSLILVSSGLLFAFASASSTEVVPCCGACDDGTCPRIECAAFLPASD